MGRPNRREFLQTSAALAASSGLAAGCPTDPGLPPEVAPERSAEPAPWQPEGSADSALFPLGVQSGDPVEDAVILWTHYTGSEALTLELVVAEGDSAWVEERTESITPDADGFVKLDITGLLPDTAYSYTFRDASGARSLAGRLRTAPPADSWRIVTFGANSCTRQDHAPFPVLSAASAELPDFYLLGGDTTYCDGNMTLAEYRGSWATNYASQGYLDLRSRTSTLMTWDDHEVENVNTGEWGVSPERFELARDVFWEHNTIGLDPAHPFRIWRSLRFGRAVEVFVLDCRSERDVAAGLYLSTEQMEWLKAGLNNSDAVFKIVLNSVPIANMAAGQQAESLWDNENFIGDRWEAFAQRAEIFDYLEANEITGVIWVSGDIHMPLMSRVELEGPWTRHWDVIVGPGGNSMNPLIFAMETNEQIPWIGEAENTVLFTADPVEETLEVRFIGADGAVMYSQLIERT